MFSNSDALPSPLQPSEAAAQQESTADGMRTELRVVDSNALLKGQKTVDIVHNGLVYRLQATRLGKLILTK